MARGAPSVFISCLLTIASFPPEGGFPIHIDLIYIIVIPSRAVVNIRCTQNKAALTGCLARGRMYSEGSLRKQRGGEVALARIRQYCDDGLARIFGAFRQLGGCPDSRT